MDKKIISSLVSILVLTTSASYAMDDQEDLKRRQNTVSKQLKEHQRLNKINSVTHPTFL